QRIVRPQCDGSIVKEVYWLRQFESSHVQAILQTREAALVSRRDSDQDGNARFVAGINRRTGGQQRVRLRGSTVIPERGEQRFDQRTRFTNQISIESGRPSRGGGEKSASVVADQGVRDAIH